MAELSKPLSARCQRLLDAAQAQYTQQLADAQVKFDADLEAAQNKFNSDLLAAQTKYDADLLAAKTKFDADLDTMQKSYDRAVAEAKSTFDQGLLDAEARYNAALAAKQSEFDSALAGEKADFAKALAELDEFHKGVESDLQADIRELTQELSDALARIAELEGPRSRFPGDPGPNHLYYGESREGGDPSSREASFGHVVGIFRSYFQANELDKAFSVAKRDHAAGRIPSMSFKLPASWADMASGSQDSWVNQLMSGLAALVKPVWVTLHHEPIDEADGGKNTGATYKAMYKHVYSLKASNVALVPIVQSGVFDNVGGQGYRGFVLTDWIDPSAADIVGYDIYNHWHPNGTFYKWRDVPSTMRFVDLVSQTFPGKVQGIFEYGVHTDPSALGKAAQWMKDFQAALVAHGDVVCMSYFDSGQNVFDGGPSWALDNYNTERLDAFKATLTASGNVFLPK